MRLLRDAVVVVVGPVLDVPLHAVLLLLVSVQNTRLCRFVAAHITGITHHLMLGAFVKLEVYLGGSDVLTLVTVELSPRMLGKLVPLQAAELCGLVRADVAVVRFPAVVSRLADSLVLGLFVPRQAALLRGNVTALVASILWVLLLLGLDAARLTPGVVHLVKAVPDLLDLLMLDHLVLRRRRRFDRVLLGWRLQVQRLVVVQPPRLRGVPSLQLLIGAGAGPVARSFVRPVARTHHEVGPEVGHAWGGPLLLL